MEVWKYVAVFTAAAMVFAVDVLLDPEVATGALHVVPLVMVLALGVATPRVVLSVAGVGAALLALDVAVDVRAHEASWPVVANVGLGVVSIAAVAFVLIREASRRGAAAAERATGRSVFHAALEVAPDAVFVVDREGKIRAANANAVRVFGHERDALVGRSIHDLVPHEHRLAHATQVTEFMAGPPHHAAAHARHVVGLRADGTRVPLEATLSYFEAEGERLCISVNRDMSSQRELEARLRASQRLESVGRLAGGVAHDFNNLLGVIMSYGKLARESLSQAHEVRDDLDELHGAAMRAAELTRQLLSFARRQVVEQRRFAPAAVVRDMEGLVRRLISEEIDLRVVVPDDVGEVLHDPAQFEQVVLNLVTNAKEAMPRGGRLTLELANVTCDANFAAARPEFAPGDYVVLAVTDTGRGLTDEERVHIFDPFYGRSEGAGTKGLGLAAAYGAVKQAKGHLAVYSEPGVGTTFRVYLPRVRDERSYAPPRAPELVEASGGRILVVEDEAALRRVAVRVLTKAGYEVVEASNGLDALRVLGTDDAGTPDRPFDLLLADVVMPSMGGRELARRLAEAGRVKRVLYMSGYTENAIVHQGVLDSDAVLLQKPFGPDELLRRVRQALLEAPL